MEPLKHDAGPGRGISLRLRWAFALTSLAFLLTVAWAFRDEQGAEWRRLQRRFHELQAAGALAAADEDATQGLQQIWLPELDRVDRCTSCHLGVADPAQKNAPAPFGAHPGRWLETHRPDRFGCSACHGGRGEATTFAGAGHRGRGAPDPIVSRELMEARCGSCHHERRRPDADWLTRGRALIAERNCIACHELPAYDTSEVRAPRLDGLRSKLTPAWLRAWLKDPRSLLPRSRMGDFRLGERDVEALVAFLLTERDAPTLDSVDWSQADPARGGEIFRRSRCVTCHEVDGRGGTLGPALTHVGAKTSREWLYSWIRDPQRWQPATLMPRFRFSDQELRDLAAYLASELSTSPERLDASAAPLDGTLVAEGRRVFEQRGCYSCHQLEGFPRLARIGPKLGAIGDRALEPLPLVARGIRPTLPNWIHAKLRGPEQVLDSARMPSFGFSEAEAAAVSVALLGLRRGTPPPAWTTADALRGSTEPQGEFGRLLRRYRCLSCHSLRGSGGALSTVAFDRIGSQLRRDHIERYVQQPIAVRVSLPERMPRLNVAPEEARLLADHLSRVMVDDALERPVPEDVATVARGRQLFDKHGCVACHIVGDKGGYVGPELNGSSARLKPGWTVAWLLEAERWKPGTLEPDLGLSRAEAEALAAYVLSLPARRARGAGR